ncbi:MarR family winged helix-turn-helix transcriptional regulator [Fructilactobacillus sp. Tb1]|uniref:MarR family winged helix-turn-helix transcriptional regulator n=1 Tax=Fructilactobacillus sp. Tb1 TaxID=3422304 RepID=UPI003D29870D
MAGSRQIDSELCFGIYNANKKFNRFYQHVLAEYGLTYPQYAVMLVLWIHSPITVRELGSYVDLDSGTLTPLLKRLQKNGWVTKTRSTKDERVVNINITEHAKAMRDEVYDHVNECFEILGLERDEIDKALKVVNVVSNQLDNVDVEKIAAVN